MVTEALTLLLIAWAAAAVLMVIVWALAVRIGNAGVVDIAWSAGFTPIVLLFAIAAHGAPARRLLIASMVTLWSARLSVYLAIRVLRQHPQEDRRYAQLRRQWSARLGRNLFVFFQLQGLLLALLSLPFLLISLNAKPQLTLLEGLGFGLWTIALGGEALADWQLQRFRSDPSHRRAVCEVGLWHYSRHPNYFFEWLTWVGYFIFAAASPYGWISLYCPALMLYFLLRVTGIPLTEQLSLESKGAAFADYQRRTSAFVPWLTRR